MKLRQLVVLFYAALLVVGGCFATIKAHSMMSLVTSALSSIILFTSAAYMKKKPKQALYASLGVMLILGAFFTFRALSSMKFFPSGMMSLISFAALIAVLYSLPKKRYLP